MSNPLELPADRPTRVRYAVVLVTALMAVLLYLDRFCISFAQGFIRDDLGLSNTAVDWILAAFFLSYALMQVPAGWLTDRFGARLMLTLYILLWSLFTGLTGAAYGFAVLFVLRLAFGAAQAGAYPTGAAVVSHWMPLRSRGAASSVIAVGGRIGGWAAFYITGLLIVWLVPVTVASRLVPEDLIDAPKLSHRLLSMAPPPAEDSSNANDGDNAVTVKEEASLPPAIAERVLTRL